MMYDRKKFLFFLSSIIFFLLIFGYCAWGVTHPGSIQTSLFSYDRTVQTWVHAHTTTATSKLMLSVTYAADPTIITIVVVAIVFILLLLHEELLVAFFAGSLAVGSILAQYVKHLAARPRPLDLIFDISHPGYSFPSAHALIATVFYGFIGYCLLQVSYKRWQKITIVFLTTLLIAGVGMSRVVLGVHWISDVIGGWSLGLALLVIIIWLFHKMREKIYGPFRIPHGMALIVIFLIISICGFSVSYYYVTHLSSVRSIITTHH